MLRAVERELRRAVVSGGAWAILGRALATAAALAVTALVTRRAAATDAAAYFVVISIIVTAASLAQLGVQVTVVRVAAQALASGNPGRARGAISSSLRFTLLAATLCALVALGVAPFDAFVRVVTAACIVLYALQLVSSEALRGLHAIGAATLTGTVIAPLVALVGVALVDATLARILIAIAISYAAAALTGLAIVRIRTRNLGAPERVPLRAITATALPAWIGNLAFLLFVQVDLWIAAAFLPAASVAAYGAASRVSNTLIVPLLVVNAVIAPMIADLFTRDRMQQLQLVLRGTAAIAAIPATVVVIVLALFGRPLLELAFGPGYGAAAPLVLLLAAGQTVNVLTGSCGLALLMTGHERLLMRFTVSMLIVTAIAAAVAARTWGATGIAATFAIGMAALNVMLAAAVHRATGLRTWAGAAAMLALVRGERHAA